MSNLRLPWNNRVCSEIFHCIEYFFYHAGFLSNFALALKNRFAQKFFTVLNILFAFRIFEQLALALKNRVALKIFTLLNMYFLSFRIFEQLVLALKSRVCPENFQARGRGRPPPEPPPRTSMYHLWLQLRDILKLVVSQQMPCFQSTLFSNPIWQLVELGKKPIVSEDENKWKHNGKITETLKSWKKNYEASLPNSC